MKKLNAIRFHFLIALLLVLMPAIVFAAKEKRNIYLFDCTNSMEKYGLWSPAKEALFKTIQTQSEIPNSEFIIIPFGDTAYPAIEFTSAYAQDKRKEIEKRFDENMQKAKSTNITSVLKAGFAKCDPARENRIYLFTDGMPNSGDSPHKVVEAIRSWCGSHANSRLFYVALKDGVVNEEIRKAIDECNDAYVLQCKNNIIPEFLDIQEIYINANIVELPSDHKLGFSVPGNVPLKVECADPYFAASIVGGKSVDEVITVRLSARGNQDVETLHSLIESKADSDGVYRFNINITSPKPNEYYVSNPTVIVNMDDHLQTKLTLLSGDADEYDAGNCSWHDKILWSKASVPGTVEIDLSPKFENIEGSARTAFRVVAAQDQPEDFIVYFNSKPVGEDGVFIVNPSEPAILKIEFANDAKQGKRYFTLKSAGVENVEIINGVAVDDFEGIPLRAKYSVNWNPLKTLLFWLGIIIGMLLLLWLALLKYIFYPRIKVAKVTFTGPGPYFKSKRIKGAIKVVLSSGRRSQSLVNRWFTGSKIFIRADHFTPEIEIVPGQGKGKKIRLRSVVTGEAGWTFSPSAVLTNFEKTEAYCAASKQKFSIDTN